MLVCVGTVSLCAQLWLSWCTAVGASVRASRAPWTRVPVCVRESCPDGREAAAQMLKRMADGELDVTVGLTEGLVNCT
jgi:hypothetical protein